MDENSRADAEALWSDTIDLMRSDDTAPAALVAMLEKCTPKDFDGEHIIIEAPARFMKLQIERNVSIIQTALANAAFMPVLLSVEIGTAKARPIQSSSVVSEDELQELTNSIGNSRPTQDVVAKPVQISQPTLSSPAISFAERSAANPLVSEITENDSKLTFSRFVEGEENRIALQAAKQVADGFKNYNPLFIYGKSGLGKTHLLKAIQNYILQNDIEKICVYRVSHDFVNDYVTAMRNPNAEVKEALRLNYRDVDILIIDDIQFLKGPGTIGFFFDLFNYLTAHDKQIVLAADESPLQLGIGNQDFDERLVSRLGSGFACPIQTPDYDLKLALVTSFYQRMKEDAIHDHTPGYEGEISDANLSLMAERAGTNIRVIESFCQLCLLEATKKQRVGEDLTRDDISHIASQKFGVAIHEVSIERIQKLVEEEFHVTHTDLVGSSRKKEIMIPRQVGCWLARSLTDMTLAEIGDRFGGRSHATVLYSIGEVDKSMQNERVFFDRVTRIKERLLDV